MDRMTDEVRQESPWAMTFADDTVICSERLDGWRCEGEAGRWTYREQR